MDYNQKTLFGSKIISSISYNEQEILRDILFLHANGKTIDVDPCYSAGNFYKKGITQPKYKFDKFPQLPDVVEATSDNLPLENESVEVIVFDPPFVMGGEIGEDSKEGSCIIAKRFTNFQNFDELKEMYSNSLREFYRILKPSGIVIFKCQDCISSAKQHLTHVWTIMEAIKIGYYPKDLFILLAKSRLTDNRVQQHCRKFHSYYLVLQKYRCKVDYSSKIIKSADLKQLKLSL